MLKDWPVREREESQNAQTQPTAQGPQRPPFPRCGLLLLVRILRLPQEQQHPDHRQSIIPTPHPRWNQGIWHPGHHLHLVWVHLLPRRWIPLRLHHHRRGRWSHGVWSVHTHAERQEGNQNHPGRRPPAARPHHQVRIVSAIEYGRKYSWEKYQVVFRQDNKHKTIDKLQSAP